MSALHLLSSTDSLPIVGSNCFRLQIEILQFETLLQHLSVLVVKGILKLKCCVASVKDLVRKPGGNSTF